LGEKNWSKKGVLPEGALPKAVAVSPEGYGLVAAYTEPAVDDLHEQLRGRKALLLRATSTGSETVYDGSGWIQALDGNGAVWFAVAATLKASGEGSDYRLLRSTDGGKSWQGRGPILATSVAQVLAIDEQRAWVLGSGYLGVTTDGGHSWTPVAFDGDRDPTVERLRRVGEDVALLGDGVLATSRELTHAWTRESFPGARVHDFDGRYVVVSKEGQVGVGLREGGATRWLGGLPEGHTPLRITSAGPVVRVLSRAAEASKGVDLTLYRSEDGGESWSAVPLNGLRAEADIAGGFGLGLTYRGELRGNL
jgi:photosystem II stability/assembly factor-like uncharacterized protein